MPTKSFPASLTMAAATVLIAGVVMAPSARASKVPFGPPMHLHYIVAPTGNEARYRVRETLVGKDFPNDAVGVTQAVTGNIVVDTSGKVVEDSSKITINVVGLKTDQTRRDKSVRESVLETDKFPTVEIVPSFIKGVGGPPPASGTRPVEILGNLKVHGNTLLTTWRGSATFAGDDITGKLATAFTFAEIHLTKPSRAIVLGVEDTIKLEYDFHLIKK